MTILIIVIAVIVYLLACFKFLRDTFGRKYRDDKWYDVFFLPGMTVLLVSLIFAGSVESAFVRWMRRK